MTAKAVLEMKSRETRNKSFQLVSKRSTAQKRAKKEKQQHKWDHELFCV